jgi:hypothetical protein
VGVTVRDSEGNSLQQCAPLRGTSLIQQRRRPLQLGGSAL